MMGKVGAARPPDKANVWKVAIHTIVLIRRTGVFQRFDNACDRDFIDRIDAARYRALHRSQYRRAPRRVAAVGEMIRQPKAAARRTNLP